MATNWTASEQYLTWIVNGPGVRLISTSYRSPNFQIVAYKRQETPNMFRPNSRNAILTGLVRHLATVRRWLRAPRLTELEYLGLL